MDESLMLNPKVKDEVMKRYYTAIELSQKMNIPPGMSYAQFFAWPSIYNLAIDKMVKHFMYLIYTGGK